MPREHAALNPSDLCYLGIATWYEPLLFQTLVKCHGQRLQPVTKERNTLSPSGSPVPQSPAPDASLT
ncbi:MAG: hypothetical protein KME46_24615 [Brasilonema angustatum HA4187-MV1]|nr:hypothetical protein [Brasilonema angustatum HA4187-MV1]